MAHKSLYYNVKINGIAQDIISVEVNESHGQTCARVSVELERINGFTLNSYIEVDMGYIDSHGIIFRGFVDDISDTRPDGTHRIEGRDVLKRAIEHFLVTTDLENPWSRSNITAEHLVGDLLHEAGIVNYSGDTTLFTFGVTCPAEFNLMSSWDAVNTICNIIAYNCYAVDGIVYFKRITTTPSGPPTFTFKSGSPGSGGNVTFIEYSYNTDNLRNKVVVFGRYPVYAEAKEASPYLPSGFYKTAIVSSEMIDDDMAQRSADYNLALYNKLTETLRVEAEGDYRVRCRKTVRITEPFTGMLNSDWFVTAVTHRISNDGFQTSVSMVR